MWAGQDATVPRTDAESGPIALGSLCSVATGCRGSRSVKRSDEQKELSCDGCLAAFKLQLERTEGVTASEVSLEKREASVTYDPEKTDVGMIGESLLKKGFDVRLAPWEPVDASFKGCSNGFCGSRRPGARVGSQPGATTGQEVYGLVSGVVLRINELTPRASVNVKPFYICCEACLRYFQANRDRVLALRGIRAASRHGFFARTLMKKRLLTPTLALLTSASFAVGGDATAKAALTIKGMTCGGCVAAVKLQLRRTEGVIAYEVSLEKGEAEVTYNSAKTDPERIAESVSKTGFQATVKGQEKVGPTSDSSIHPLRSGELGTGSMPRPPR
jgi:copper chaperone